MNRLDHQKVDQTCRVCGGKQMGWSNNIGFAKWLNNIISDVCLLCGSCKESIDYFFLHCEFAYAIWCQLLAKCSILWCFPKILLGLFKAWGFSHCLGCGDIIWRLVPFIVLWSIWNERIFRGVSCSLDDLLSYLILWIAKLASCSVRSSGPLPGGRSSWNLVSLSLARDCMSPTSKTSNSLP